MKFNLFLCTFLAAFSLAAGHAQASSVFAKVSLTLSGTIYQTPVNSSSPIAKIALTKKALLVYFGYPSVDPNTTAFYYNYNPSASKREIDLVSADGLTTYGTVLYYGTEDTSVTGKGGSQVLSDRSADFLNGDVSGEILETSATLSGGKSSVTLSFSGSGQISSTSYIIKGVIKSADSLLAF
ncbi:MAG: hypothetical protein QM796_17885 [Chthoniobacteraceae bacterium]